MNLKLPADSVMIERSGKFLFLVPSKPDWLVTNANGAYVLSLCDGIRSVDQILESVGQQGLSVNEANIFISLQISNGFFNPSNEEEKYQAVYKPILRSVHLNVHPDCNLKCNYCYAEERSPSGRSLSYLEYESLIDDLYGISKGIHIALTGGEPLLNKSTPKISEYCRSKGFHTQLLTNATPINSKNAQYIAGAFDQIRISIDGSFAELNDFHRGQDTYDKITSAIDLLDKHGAEVLLAMTVTKKNISNIGEMAKIYGGRLTFQPLFNAGNAKLNAELAISGDKYYKALADAENVSAMANIGDSLMKLKNNGTTRCAIGGVEISISHNGDVFPCHLVHLEDFKAGNIREQSIVDIYNSSPALLSARNLSIYARAECAECPIRLLCGGSCRARALYLEGDLNACDDFCDYEFSSYIDGIFQASTKMYANPETVSSF
ncbi:radical SAM protein [Polynucleobacter sp. MWH-Mekk-B1]|uniref:radical SAM/SPASM domain-containing protein n=1 Tax=Polynucleobacter finlandensis TaxID=1855894 RepID=UPI001C0B9FCF|nr:radical SAM protein [Polynucleobacter finlandensis]MBU3544166.1 radical SAM protein [Polynucleobacter finlandensis]